MVQQRQTDGVDVVFTDQACGATCDERRGQHEVVRCRTTEYGAQLSNSRSQPRRRGVHHDLVGRRRSSRVLQVRLDATGSGREVVGDQQGPAHRLSPGSANDATV